MTQLSEGRMLYDKVSFGTLSFSLVSQPRAMQKIRIPRTPIKIFYNIVFLFALNVLVHMALWQTWKPWAIFTQRMIAP